MGFLSLPAQSAQAFGRIAEWKCGQRLARRLPATEFDGAASRETDNAGSSKHRDLHVGSKPCLCVAAAPRRVQNADPIDCGRAKANGIA
jgi:hypothetical protein